MANYAPFIKRFFNIDAKTIFHDVVDPKDPHEFQPNGSQIYHGYQGEGKTISMYYHAMKLKSKYPRSLLVTNLKLRDYAPLPASKITDFNETITTLDTSKQYISFESHDDLILCLKLARNGKYGVIFMIDEIHNYFHSHDSKSMPMWVVQVFSQQRKQRLVVLGSVQDWEDVIKAIRRQVDNLIACKRMGHLILHTVVDPREFESQYGERVAPVRKKGFFWITKNVREGYDTYQVVNSGRELLGGNDLAVNVNMQEMGKKSKNK